jgi:hypothetical protein
VARGAGARGRRRASSGRDEAGLDPLVTRAPGGVGSTTGGVS